jgi:hypothetical protein
VLASRVIIDKEDLKWSIDGKMIDQFRGCTAGGVGEGTAWTSIAQPFDEGVHFRPMIAKAQTMKSAVGIEMTTYRVRMKCDENNIA